MGTDRQQVVSPCARQPHYYAMVMCTNYVLKCLTAMRARELGGTFGILVDEQGWIAESCVLNASFVLPDETGQKRLVTPTFERALNGTTVRQVLAMAHGLVDKGLIASAEQRNISEDEARSAVEVFLTGGDTHLYAITHWDEKPVGNGEVGPVAIKLLQMLENEAYHGSTEHLDVPYQHVTTV